MCPAAAPRSAARAGCNHTKSNPNLPHRHARDQSRTRTRAAIRAAATPPPRRPPPRVASLDLHPDIFSAAIVEGARPLEARLVSSRDRVPVAAQDDAHLLPEPLPDSGGYLPEGLYGAVGRVAFAVEQQGEERDVPAEAVEFKSARAPLGDGARAAAGLDKAISYIGNHLGRMDYAAHGEMGLPIGSGVTGAACKSVVKERLCGSGMKWTMPRAADVLCLRAMTKSAGRWEEFWTRASRFGVSKITRSKRG